MNLEHFLDCLKTTQLTNDDSVESGKPQVDFFKNVFGVEYWMNDQF
jgi:hypothetical protein